MNQVCEFHENTESLNPQKLPHIVLLLEADFVGVFPAKMFHIIAGHIMILEMVFQPFLCHLYCLSKPLTRADKATL